MLAWSVRTLLALALGASLTGQPLQGQWTSQVSADLSIESPMVWYFGEYVAVDGDRAVVTSVLYGAMGNTGRAYAYTRQGGSWGSGQTLLPPGGVSGFGYGLDLHEDLMVIGVLSSSARVYRLNGGNWILEDSLLPSAGAGFGSSFGEVISISPDKARVAVSGRGYMNVGSVSVFKDTGSGQWTETHVLGPAGSPTSASFGADVAIDDDLLLVGDSINKEVYVFERIVGTGWVEMQRLQPANMSASQNFGDSIALSGDTVLFGSSGYDGAADDAGAVYVFERIGGTWVETDLLEAQNASPNDRFGAAVALDGNVAVVGAYGVDVGGQLDAGSAFVFSRQNGGWNEELELAYPTPTAFGNVGNAVDVSGTTVVLGDNRTNSNHGTAAIFELSPTSLAYCTPGTSASGCQAELSFSGTPSATATSGFTVSAASVEGAKDGLFFFGANGKQATPWGSGTSFQCVVPPVTRAGILTGSGSPGACDGAFAQDLNALWCPSCPKPTKNPGAGVQVQTQLWYRDPLNTSNQTTGLSDAYEFLIQP